MKKILSLILVMAMLLSAVPMTWAAEQDVGTAASPKHYASLVLKDSIAINFKVTRAWLAENAFEKAEFLMGGEVVQTINGLPAGDAELAVFSFEKLTPAQMSEKVTVRYCFANMDPVEKTYSVLDYSKSVLEDANENPLLKTAIVDMLSYGAAAQTYNNQTVNADLSETLTTYASLGTAEPKALTKNSALTGDEGEVKWLAVGLNLKDSVTLRFKFSTPEADGLTLKLTSNGQTWEITNFEEAADGNYYAYFNGLNPAQLRQVVYGEFYAEGVAVSNKLAYSVESYAADNASDPEDLKALTAALMVYGDAVYTWAYTYLAGSDLTYIEAEDVILFTGKDSTLGNQTPVIVADNEGANNKKVAKWNWTWANSNNCQNYVTFGETVAEKPAHISFNVKASAGTTYYVWARVSHKTGSNVVVCVDGDANRESGWRYLSFTAAASETDFVWTKVATCTWAEGGVYSVNFRARNGGSAHFDQFMVTSTNVTPHDHVYSEAWSTDETYHWHACTVDGCTTVADKAEHTFGDDGLCTDCGKVDFYVADSNWNYIEAEDVNLFTTSDSTYNNNVPVVSVEDSTASGGNYIKLAQGANANYTTTNSNDLTAYPAHVSFEVKASETGTYYIWAKVSQSGANIWSYIDGITKRTGNLNITAGGWAYDAFGTTDGFAWVKIATCSWTAGETYGVRFRSRQAGTILIDQFMVTSAEATPHDHVYSEAWMTDETYHWHACTVDGCTVVADKAEHDYGTTGVCVCGKVSFYVAGSNQTYIEAEDVNLLAEKDTTSGNVQYADIDESGEVVMLGTSGGGAASHTTQGDTTLPAHVSFDVKTSAGGTYYIWAKVSQKDASVSTTHYCYIDGIKTRSNGATPGYSEGWTYDAFGTEYGTYKWVKIATCEWSEGGTYSVRFRARQQVILIDQFMVTSDSTFTPT